MFYSMKDVHSTLCLDTFNGCTNGTESTRPTNSSTSSTNTKFNNDTYLLGYVCICVHACMCVRTCSGQQLVDCDCAAAF